MVDGKKIPMVSCYKYLSCVVDELSDLRIRYRQGGGREEGSGGLISVGQSKSGRCRYQGVQEADMFSFWS